MATLKGEKGTKDAIKSKTRLEKLCTMADPRHDQFTSLLAFLPTTDCFWNSTRDFPSSRMARALYHLWAVVNQVPNLTRTLTETNWPRNPRWNMNTLEHSALEGYIRTLGPWVKKRVILKNEQRFRVRFKLKPIRLNSCSSSVFCLLDWYQDLSS